ncbi:MAG: efflux RND transporter permease subunit [Planctomycetota bacterium]
MDPVRFSITNPVKVAVGVILLVLMGLVSLGVIPVQLVPETSPTIVTVTTEWTGRSPIEIERELVEPQEDVFKGINGLVAMRATAYEGESEIELEFELGVDLKQAKLDVSNKLREVTEFPDGAEEPRILAGEAGAGSPIAWLLLTSTGPQFDVQLLGRAAEEKIKPALERVNGVSEARVYGGREWEVHVEFDPQALAQRGLTVDDLNAALRSQNVNVSAGQLAEGAYDGRIASEGEYERVDQVERTVLAHDAEGGPIRVSDVATVRIAAEKRRSFVRSRGERALAMPVYRESGANVIDVMAGVRERVDFINANVLPGVALDVAERLGLDAPPTLQIRKVYDETNYIYAALGLVQNNLVVGGALAVVVLLTFLELGRRPKLVLVAAPGLVALLALTQLASGPWETAAQVLMVLVMIGVLLVARPTLVVALAIPISVIGTFVVMVALGRNVNVISLAGLAFAVGMVVDNAIVVLENIDRHLAMGKRPAKAAYDAGVEVWGAILASSLTTVVVFVPVLLMQDEAGQLFRDIAIAISAAVVLSLVVSITVIPAASSRLLRKQAGKPAAEPEGGATVSGAGGRRPLGSGIARGFGSFSRGYANLLHTLMDPSWPATVFRVAALVVIAGGSILGAAALMPKTDYLPAGNKNLVFGFLVRPPGFTLDNAEDAARATESTIRPYWSADTYEDLSSQDLPPVPNTFGDPTVKTVEGIPPLANYFHVSFRGNSFHGATSKDPENIRPIEGLLASAVTTNVPGAFGIAFQASLFGQGAEGTRAVKINLVGDDLGEVRDAATWMQNRLRGEFGFGAVRSEPQNFDLQAREATFEIDRVKASDLGVTQESVNRAIESFVDGTRVGEFRDGAETIDILAIGRPKRVDDASPDRTLEQLAGMPIAYRQGDETGIVRLDAVADYRRTLAPQEVRRVEEERAVTINVSPEGAQPLEEVTARIEQIIEEGRAAGAIPPTVDRRLDGAAAKLEQIRASLLGQWQGWTLASLQSLVFSRLFLALLVVYLLMAALFESFVYPFVIMLTVPLAAAGGLLGLRFVHDGWGMVAPDGTGPLGFLGPQGWGVIEPSQNLDVLTMLGFVILIGVVVNNAILIVHQSLNFMRGLGEGEGDRREAMPPREAIAESVRTRIRPIFMTTLTSVAGMAPLVVAGGAGSELYRGLGSVVVGGLLVATFFTLLVAPLLLSLVMDVKGWVHRRAGLGPVESDHRVDPITGQAAA